MSSPLLEARALDYGFPGRTIGRGVDLSLAAGEMLAVLGPNGEGKTTLFRTLLGLIPPLGGEVRLGGDALGALARDEIARRAGYVPQAHAGAFSFSVMEMVLMGRTAHLGAFASPSARDRDSAMRSLESMGIAALAEKPFNEISGGERQLALIARALAQEAKLLVMDEPTANLDFGNQVRVLECARRLARTGIAVLFSTHHPDHALLAADRAVLLKDGRVLERGKPREVIRADTLEALYGVKVDVVATAGGGACVPAFGVA